MSTSQFFIVCQPGFEEELLLELNEFWPYLLDSDSRPNAQPFQVVSQSLGGILIEAPLMLGLQINFFSRLASRILLRVSEFRVRDFPKLHERLRKLQLDSFFAKKPFRVEVAASQSRLNNEKRILQICEELWPSLSEAADAALLIRMHDDTCTVSVDTSGAHLHLRGNPDPEAQKWVGDAPLRETVAAFMLRTLSSSQSYHELQSVTLWDPMAGSGTLLQEARTLLRPNFLRKYAFQSFPQCPKILKSENLAHNFVHFPTCFFELWASDQDPKMVEALKHNLPEEAKIFQADFFEAGSLPHRPRGPLWMVLNPPYGERLSMKKSFQELGLSLSKMEPERVGILTPRGFSDRLMDGMSKNKNHRMVLRDRHFFKNGGIPVEFTVFIRE
jgi:putative N6-adenine-specific DNA methylase